ncbi:MAG: N-acetyltransferase [Anaeroplasmataceae bacterium]|nr:N-acetyltransferase [Anaeroplasmataceae bacterium]
MNIIKEKNKVYILNENNEEIAFITFPQVEEGVVLIDHTYVSEELRGMKIAERLMEQVYEVIRSNGYKAIPQCSYAKHWFEKHPLNQDVLYECPYTSVG